MLRGRFIAGRVGWGVADQALSSITNFSLGVAMARAATLEEFGAYGLLFSAYLIAINVTRPIAIEPLLIRFSGRLDDRWNDALADASGTVAAAGSLLGILGIVIGLTQPGFLGSGFVILGLTLPGLVLQDGWRFALFAARRGATAFVNDLIWGATLVLMIVFLEVRDAATPLNLLAAWGLSGDLAGLVGVAQTKAWPRPLAARRWWKANHDLGQPLLGDRVASNVVGELTPYAIGAIAGLSAVGALRAAQLLLGPFTVLVQGVGLVALPEAVGLIDRSTRVLIRAAAIYSGALALLVLATGSLIMLLPAEVGMVILGKNWSSAHDILLPYTAFAAVQMSVAGPAVGLRALGEVRATFRVGVIRSALGFMGAIAGASTGGAASAATGMALGTGVGAIETWRAFLLAVDRRGIRRTPSTGTQEEGKEATPS
jgi:O-antigen/teichoic acid export membrane protein